MKLKKVIKELKDIDRRLGSELEVRIEPSKAERSKPIEFIYTMGDPIKVYILAQEDIV